MVGCGEYGSVGEVEEAGGRWLIWEGLDVSGIEGVV